MIAITVSTNFADLLPIVYQYNHKFFKHWVIVTSKNDYATIDFLTSKPNVTVLFWNFKNNQRVFDKGGAVRYAQEYVYEKFPDDWYLIIDSDICLYQHTSPLNYISNYDSEAIYGLENRLDFASLNDLLAFKNFIKHVPIGVDGFFQLYRKKAFL
jgi:hypothetical protein